jgi:hypothetical protein
MKSLAKYTLPLITILSSGLGLSNSAFAQYPNQLQIYQTKCAQGDQFSCIQYEQMLRRNERWANERNERHNRFYQDQQELNRINRREACRRGSRDFNNSYCNYIR